MLALVDARTGRIIERHEDKTLMEFLESEWGGWSPYYLDGRLHKTYGLRGSWLGCVDETRFWVELDNKA